MKPFYDPVGCCNHVNWNRAYPDGLMGAEDFAKAKVGQHIQDTKTGLIYEVRGRTHGGLSLALFDPEIGEAVLWATRTVPNDSAEVKRFMDLGRGGPFRNLSATLNEEQKALLVEAFREARGAADENGILPHSPDEDIWDWVHDSLGIPRGADARFTHVYWVTA